MVVVTGTAAAAAVATGVASKGNRVNKVSLKGSRRASRRSPAPAGVLRAEVPKAAVEATGEHPRLPVARRRMTAASN